MTGIQRKLYILQGSGGIYEDRPKTNLDNDWNNNGDFCPQNVFFTICPSCSNNLKGGRKNPRDKLFLCHFPSFIIIAIKIPNNGKGRVSGDREIWPITRSVNEKENLTINIMHIMNTNQDVMRPPGIRQGKIHGGQRLKVMMHKYNREFKHAGFRR